MDLAKAAARNWYPNMTQLRFSINPPIKSLYITDIHAEITNLRNTQKETTDHENLIQFSTPLSSQHHSHDPLWTCIRVSQLEAVSFGKGFQRRIALDNRSSRRLAKALYSK